MELKEIPLDFSVCKVTDYSGVSLSDEFCFTGRTDEENSLVCPTARVPGNTTAREDGWRALRIQGVLDFSLIGILAKIAHILAQHQISLFVISTYNTDYVLLKQEKYAAALAALAGAGYTIVP